MLTFLPPALLGTKKYIRDLASSVLPAGNTYWFEELPQIPFILQKQIYTLETSQIGVRHEFFLNGKLYKTIVPNTSPFEVKLVLNPGIYEYKISNSKEETVGAFQVSVKEFLWQSWINSLEKPFQDIRVIEGRFKNPLNLILLEVTYPPDILNLSNSPWTLRNFAQASSTVGIQASFDFFASGLLKNSAIFANVDYGLVDTQKEYSKLSLHFVHPTLARRGFFLQHRDPKLVKDATWNYAIIEDSSKRTPIEPQSLDYLSTINVHTDTDLATFALYNENVVFLGNLTLNADKSSVGSYYYDCPLRIPEGIYHVSCGYVAGRIKPGNVTVSLSPKENRVLELPYLPARTSIHITPQPPTQWLLVGHNVNLGIPDIISYTDYGIRSIDLEDDYVQGYQHWTLSLVTVPGFIMPDPLELYPQHYERLDVTITMIADIP
jgi:hypothetical protein